MRVARVQHPAPVGERPVLDDLADELDAEPGAAMALEDVHVGQVHEPCGVAVDRSGEADLSTVLVEADDVRARVDQLVLSLAAPSLCPVGLAPEVRVDGTPVEPGGVVVELVAVSQVPHHG